jgi:hypothetical protein
MTPTDHELSSARGPVAAPKPAPRRFRRIAVAGVVVLALVLSGLIATAVVVRQRKRAAADRAAAQACRLPTDAAGRQYLRRQAQVAGIVYIDSLTAMYRHCPHRGVVVARRAPGAGSNAGHASSPTATTRPPAKGDEGDDGGD